jgi:hypothetical protein
MRPCLRVAATRVAGGDCSTYEPFEKTGNRLQRRPYELMNACTDLSGLRPESLMEVSRLKRTPRQAYLATVLSCVMSDGPKCDRKPLEITT